MCTLTFIPTADGYLAGMNRDELRTRPIARPPQARARNGVGALYPTESSGGTWIACNRYGILFALLNWSDIEPDRVHAKAKSRGVVIPKLIAASSLAEAVSTFERLALDALLPFRLFGFFAGEKTATMWRWDGKRKDRRNLPWSRGHWFSSSVSDRAAEQQRRVACEAAAARPDFGTRSSLRRLHASHIPSPGPFSVCVHRHDAATVSYTEVVCRKRSILMRYAAGNPCRKREPHEVSRIVLRRDALSRAT